VSYYGSGIADRLDAAPQIKCPVIFHFGGADQFLTVDQSDRIAATFANRDTAEVHVQPAAGHAFDNFRAPIFYHAEAAATAWPITTAFLARHFPA
jgi:carboxymethylenebutenolidase